MNKRDISEIKRRLNAEKNAITCIRGCYVQKDGDILSSFNKSLLGMPREEAEKYMAIFRRVLSGDMGQSLQPMEWEPAQVMTSSAHHALMRLRDTALKDDESVNAFYRQIISSLQPEDNYLILLMHDGYDVPFKNANDETDHDRGTEIFSYFICAVCPVKLSKSTLSYFSEEKDFHTRDQEWVVGAPQLGLMFPAFSERSSDIYSALLYSRDTEDPHELFVENILGTEPVMPPDTQRSTFSQVLEDGLGDECSLEAVQAVQDMVLDAIEEGKKDKKAPPLVFSAEDVRGSLIQSGVSLEKADDFTQRYADAFGSSRTVLNAVNVAPTRQFEVKTPSVSIRVDPEKSGLVETRMIDGQPYILIRADESVTVNGVSVQI